MFPNSGRNTIGTQAIRFNGIDITCSRSQISINQKYYAEKLELAHTKSLPFTTFRSMRQKLAYMAYSTMPDVLVYISRIAQYTQSMYDEDKDEVLRI